MNRRMQCVRTKYRVFKNLFLGKLIAIAYTNIGREICLSY